MHGILWLPSGRLATHLFIIAYGDPGKLYYRDKVQEEHRSNEAGDIVQRRFYTLPVNFKKSLWTGFALHPLFICHIRGKWLGIITKALMIARFFCTMKHVPWDSVVSWDKNVVSHLCLRIIRYKRLFLIYFILGLAGVSLWRRSCSHAYSLARPVHSLQHPFIQYHLCRFFTCAKLSSTL